MPAPSRAALAASIVAITLVLSAVLAAPGLLARLDAERDLAPSSIGAANSVVQAIDAASAPVLAALVPGSDAYTRASAIVAGEKEAAEAVTLAASSLDLALVKAVAAGAVESAAGMSTTNVASDELFALNSDAEGWMRGILVDLASAEPGSDVADAMRAATDAFMAGATTAYDESHPWTDASAHVRWASAASTAAFASVSSEASQDAGTFGGILGAPWMPYFADAATSVVAEAATLFPADASAGTLDALGASTGGELAGMLAGLAGSLDGEMPGAALSGALTAWYDGLSAGAYGAMPLADDAATLDALALWSSALAEAGAEGLVEIVSLPAPATIEAWASAVSGAGLAAIADSGALGADAHAAIAAYAAALSGNALTYLSGADPTPGFLLALDAWGEGMTAGVGLVTSPTEAELALLTTWIEALATTAGDLPALGSDDGEGADAIRAFAEGAVAGPAALIGTLGTFPLGGADPLVVAFAEALGASRNALVESPPPALDPVLLEAFVGGVSTGFLSDPHLLFSDAKANREALGVLLAAAFDAGGANLAWTTDPTRDEAVSAFGDAFGTALNEWLDPQAQWAIDFADATPGFLAGWALGTVDAGLDAIGELGSSGAPPPKETLEERGDAIRDYALAVLREASGAWTVVRGGADVAKGARAYAEVAMTPVGWIRDARPKATAEAARAFLEGFVAEANPTKLPSDAWRARALAIVNGTGAGVAGSIPAYDGPEPTAAALAWVTGMGEGLGTAPIPAPGERVSAWSAWSSAATAAAVSTAENGTLAEVALIERLAASMIENLTFDPTEPDLGGAIAPLEAWAFSTIGWTAAHLPDGLDAPAQDAWIAYATGVQTAVESLPDAFPDAAYAGEQIAALQAWATGISAGAGAAAKDAEELLARYVDCGCEPPQDALLAYAGNLAIWAQATTQAGVAALPSTTPTADGIAALGAWAQDLDPTADPVAFAEAREESILAYADVVGAGVPIVAGYQPVVEGSADALEAYLRGAAAAAGEHFLGAPIGDPSDPWDLTWTVALLDALTRPGSLENARNASPEELNAHYAFVAAAALGGYDAAGVGFDATVDQTETLALFAEGAVGAAAPTAADALASERAAIAAYARGATKGAVQSLRDAFEAGRGVPTGEREEIVRFARWLMSFDSSWLPEAPPAGEAPAIETESWAAHAEALGGAILDLPTDPTEARMLELLGRAEAVRDAAFGVPAVGADPELARQWTLATLEGALESARVIDPERPVDPDADLARSFLSSFVAETLGALPGSPIAGDRVAEAEALALAAMETTCEGTECAPIGDALGVGAGLALLDDTIGDGHEPTSNPQQEAIDALAQGLVAALADEAPLADVPGAIAAVHGAASALLDAREDPATVAAAAEAAVAAALGASDALTPHETAELAYALAESLAPPPSGATPEAMRAWALAAADAAVEAAESESGDRIGAIRAAVETFMAAGGGSSASPSTEPSVEASDGARTHAGRDLDGTAWLSGMTGNVIAATPPPGVTGTWRLLFEDATGVAGAMIEMRPVDGRYEASVPESVLAAAGDGGLVGFVLRHETPAGSTTFDRDGEPWSYRVDAAAPTTSLAAPASSDRLAFDLQLASSDAEGAGVQGVDVWVAKNGGDFAPFIEGTKDATLTFMGEDGAVYRFRARATDAVGHAGAWTNEVETAVSIPAGSVQQNRAPTVAFLEPAAGARYRGPFDVTLDLADPDGTSPLVTVVARRPGTTAVLATIHAGAAKAFTVDTALLPDGKIELRALATDGTKSSEATSGILVIDRAGPLVRGVSVKPADDALVATVLLDGAARATIEILGADGAAGLPSVPLADDGVAPDAEAGDGAWSARVSLGDGTYRFVVRAADDLGNEATRGVPVAVEAPKPPVEPTPTPPTEPAPPTPTEPVEKVAPPSPTPLPTPAPAKKDGFRIPGPGAVLGALALLGAAAWRRRRA